MPKKGMDLGAKRNLFWSSIVTEKSDLIRKGLTSGAVQLTTTNDEGMTGLIYAASIGKERSVSAILDFAHRVRGPATAVDTPDEEMGRTALHFAAAGGFFDIVKLLLRAGANAALKDEAGKTARDLALENKKEKIVQFLDRGGESSEEEGPADEGDETSTQKNREKKRLLKEQAEKLRNAAVAAAQGAAAAIDAPQEAAGASASAGGAAAQGLNVNWSAEPAWEEIKTHLSTGRLDVTLNKLDLPEGSATVDPALWRCTSITRLALRMPEGTLNELPDTVGALTHLTTLILSRNALLSLPPTISFIGKSLKVLEISHNKLTHLPRGLHSLEVLDAAFNQLTDIEPISELTTLLSLNLDGNKLTGALPLNYGGLKRLATLGASNNQLTSLHWGIGLLTNLTELNMAGNQILNLPTELSDLSEKKLKKINLDDNPLRDPKALKILQKGKQPIKEIIAHVKKVNAPRKTEDGNAVAESGGRGGGKGGKGGKKKKKQQQVSESESEEEPAESDAESDGEGPAAKN